MLSAPSPIRSVSWQQFNSPGATSVSVNYPATVSAGDVLLLVVGAFSNSSGAGGISASGWTELDQTVNSSSGAVFWRTAAGTEGGTTFTVGLTLFNRDTTVVVYAIDGSGTPEIAVASGSSATPDPPSISPSGGSGQYLVMAPGVFAGNSAYVETFPEGFGAWLYPTVDLGVGIRSWSSARMIDATSLDPSVMEISASTTWIAWSVAIPLSVGVATFPQVESVAFSVWPSEVSHTLTLPTGIQVGDLLIAEIGTQDNKTPSMTGWDTLLGPITQGSFPTGTVFTRVADGTEGATVTVTASAASLGGGIVRRISGADATKLDGAITGRAAAATITPPSLTPADGSDDILWLAGLVNSPLDGAPRQWPVNNFIAGTYAFSDVGVYTAGTALAASSFAPSAVTLRTARPSVAWTIAVYPSDAPPPPTPSGNRMGGTGAIRKSPRGRSGRS